MLLQNKYTAWNIVHENIINQYYCLYTNTQLEVMHVIHNANEAKVPSDHIQDHKMMHPVESYHPGANQIEKSAFIGSIGQGGVVAGNAAGAGKNFYFLF